VILTLTIGWWVLWVARPAAVAAALGWAAVVGLITTLVVFPFVGPEFTAGDSASNWVVHPLRDLESVRVQERNAGIQPVSPKQEEYLRQFLSQSLPPYPVYQRPGVPVLQKMPYDGWGSQTLQMHALLERAERTNRLFAAWVGIWVGLLSTIVLTAGVVFTSVLAADYVTRSGRNWWAGVGCYAELFLPVAAAVAAVWLAWVNSLLDGRGDVLGPYWAAAGMATVLGAVSLAGVLRRWHPVIRGGLYFLWAVVAFWVVLLFRGPW
jgi:hypothetical protein